MSRWRNHLRRRRNLRAIRKAGFWFIDIPRTSSSSIRIELGRHFGAPYGKVNLIEREYAVAQGFADHIPAREMRDKLGPSLWKTIYSFTIVRNPWDRSLSLYHYRRKKHSIPNDWSFPDYIKRLVDADKSTRFFEANESRRSWADYILDENSCVLVDEIIRYENRAAGLRRVSQRIGLPDLGVLHLQAASPKGRDYRSFYDDETRGLVAERYAQDIRLFGYTF